MGRRIKNAKSLGSIFFKYVLLVLATDLVIAGIAALILIYVSAYHVIYPANYEEQQIDLVADKILLANEVTPDMIPELCEYVIFDFEGNTKICTMTAEQAKAAWFCVVNHESFGSYRGNFYYVIPRNDEYCVIQYQLEPQFVSPVLREKIEHPERLFMVLVLFLLFISMILYSIIFGKTMKKRLQIILDVTDQIKDQNLDFEIKYGKVKEINRILEALDKMRSELKVSLETQWKNEEQKKQQISSLAHDLKTPLTIVKGNNELLYDMEPTEEQKECLDYIAECSDKMSGYIQALIEVNKSEAKIMPEFEIVSSMDFFNEVKKEAEALCKTNEIKLEFICELNRDIMICKDLLFRAIMNIIDNAVSYSKKNGILKVSVDENHDQMMISVIDEGPGFSQEGLKKATTQFYMEDKSRSGQEHFGIGLYEASETAKQHGGALQIRNNEDRGACVTISIPCFYQSKEV